MSVQTDGYNRTYRLIHWTMALLIIGMIPGGFLMIQKGLDRDLQNTLFISHKNIGVLLLILIIVRIINRLRRPPQLKPIELAPIQEMAAHATHIALYVVLLVMPLMGYIRVRAGGYPIEWLDAIGAPSLVPRSDALAEFAKMVHFYGAFALAGLLCMHIGAALLHGIILKDGVFSRMWPPFRGNS